MPYRWEPGIARYRDLDTGRLVAERTIQQFVDQSIVNAKSTGATLGNLVGDGTVSPTTFNTTMRRELKAEYIRQYVLERGGRNAMDSADWGSVGGMLGEQYRHLDEFTAQIATEDLSTAQINARIKMYFNSAREAGERAKRKTKVAAGFAEVRWILRPAEHCEDCVTLSQLGWQPIDPWPFDIGGGSNCMPGTGCTVCLTNCQCVLEYR